MTNKTLELVCPAGTPAALRAAIEAGADTIYCGFRDETNARNFPGLNFDRAEMEEAVEYVHSHGKRLLVAINTFPRAGADKVWKQAVDDAARFKVDAVILADIGLLNYAKTKHPDLRLHLSVQASASSPEAIGFYTRAFEVKRVVLPRVLTLDEIKNVTQRIGIETEIFAFGGLCVMAEGRCALSSYLTGKSPNSHGACAPASHVRYEERGDKLISLLGEITINTFDKNEPAGYPTPCKGRYLVDGKPSYIFEDPVSLNTIEMLAEIRNAGVTALKIEGRQRGRAYITQVVSSFRQALDKLDLGEKAETSALMNIAEGGRNTTGAYKKAWQ